MKIGFNSNLEQRMDEYIAKHGGLEKMEREMQEEMKYRLKRLRVEQSYEEMSRLRRAQKPRPNG